MIDMGRSSKHLQPDQSITLNEALMQIPVGLFQYRLLFMCGFVFMADALEVNLMTFLATCAGDEWHLNASQQASITGIVFAGIILGTIFWGLFADRYGRKLSYMCACILICVGGLLSGASPNYYCLILFRAIAGFGIGGANVPFDLLAEFIPTSHRGKFLMLIEYFWTFGSLFVAGVAWAFLDREGWRFLAFIAAIPVTVICFVSYFYLPESPRWLLMKGRKDEAERVLRDAALVNDIVMEPFVLKDEPIPASSSSSSSSSSVVDNCKGGDTDATYGSGHSGGGEDATYMELFQDKRSRELTLMLWVIWFSFGFTYYGIVLFAGRLYASSSSSSGDDDDGGGTCTFDYQSIFITSSSEMFGCGLGAMIIDNVGRVRSQVAFYTIGGLAVFFMGFETDALVVLLVGILGRMCASIAANATWVSTPELYPTRTRTVGHASCVAVSKLASVLVPFLVTSNYSVAVVGTVLGIMNIVGAMVSTLLPETKGIDLDTTDNTSPSDILSRLSFDRKSDPHQSSVSTINSMNNPLMLSHHSGTVCLADGHL